MELIDIADICIALLPIAIMAPVVIAILWALLLRRIGKGDERAY